ncbi:glycosyltransferase [Conexibacter sp. DBS9H8]|uniref:glycosyltransferase n=1 Tax=Conexibacter sp. DBS9H8 TaxID=2937801 RepID=UPI00200C3784|nr:glycosyltransferase [Conexibacter sp. DBS9H8]
MTQENRTERHVSRADMHVHSTASELSKLGIQRSLALPECATEPEEVYELAKRRGMDFVTITDHDTIAGALAISHHPDVFVSEELTVSFPHEPQAVHVLCYGITEADHEYLQAHRTNIEECAEYLHAQEICCALAHPFYAVAAPLSPRHRRRLAQLFPVWETRNGSRAKELNLPAFVYIETHGGTGIGGSDDHAGIDIGRTFTETPVAATPGAFLAHIRAGAAVSHGAQGGAAKWTHAAMALAIRSLSDRAGERPGRPDPATVLAIVSRVMAEGELRHGERQEDVGPRDALALLRAWLASMELQSDEHELIRALQEGELSHHDLERRARRIHERELARVVADGADAVAHGQLMALADTPGKLFNACLPAVPYAAAAAFLGREKQKLTRGDGDRPRVAIVADGMSGTHGVSRALTQIRDRGVPGFDVEVIGTDADVDRRLCAAAELEMPFYPGLMIGVPTVPSLVDALAEGRYDLIHVVTPGPAGAGAWLVARLLGLPLLGSYHTELGAYAGLRSGQAFLETLVDAGMGAFYGACDVVLSPSTASDERLEGLGVARERIGRWDRGVDLCRFFPQRREPGRFPGEINVLYTGRLTREKGVELLADAFLTARSRDPRLHLILAGDGPERAALADRLGTAATFLGFVHGEELATVYASADAFLFASETDTFGQVILEAQASGLPVIAVDAGGPADLIRDGHTGLLTAADAGALAGALLTVTGSDLIAAPLRRAGLSAVRDRTWEASMAALGAGYRAALERAQTVGVREVA